MTTLDGIAAIAWMRNKLTNIPGSCLNTVWQAYGSHPSIGPHAGQYPDAIDGYNFATQRHTDMNPPAGFPFFYGPSPTRTDKDKNAGDVVISLGNGQAIATDVSGAGRIGVISLVQRGLNIQRPPLGWTSDFLGYDISTAALAGISATPIKEDDMGLPISFVKDANSKNVWVVGPGGYTGIKSPYEWSLLQRAQINDGSDAMHAEEVATVAGYLKAVGAVPAILPPIDLTTLHIPTEFTLTGKAVSA